MERIGKDLSGGGSWRPTREQLLLLRAALWQGDAALSAWQEWSARTTPGKWDSGSARLLPLLYLNLDAMHVEHALMPTLHAIYHYYWSHNHLILLRGARALEVLAAAGIPTLVLKASALIPLYYHYPGARPMNDFDVLVPTARGREALQVLQREGWNPKKRPLNEFKNEYLERQYAHTLEDAKGSQVDLHRHLSPLVTRTDGDEEFWAGAIPLSVEGVSTKALDPADQLLHACAHGMPWNVIPPIRWVADAMMILRSAQVNWDRLLEQTVRYEWVLVARHALQYLAESMNAGIPEFVLDDLRKMPVSGAAKRDYQLLTLRPTEHNVALKLWYHYEQYRRLNHIYRDDPLLMRFPAFMRDTWALPETSDVPKYMMRYSMHWLNQRLSPRKRMTKDRA